MWRAVSLASLILVLGVSVASAKAHGSGSKRNADFRAGITSHQDWIDRLRETYDYRIFKLLASRGGAPVSTERAKEVCAWLKDHPQQVTEVLTKWQIIVDHDAHMQQAMTQWHKQYGAEALIMPRPTDIAWARTHYLTLATQKDERYAKVIAYYMEKIHRLYHAKFKTKEPVEGKFIIKLYPRKADFARTRGEGNSFAFAYFRASTRELVGYVPREKSWSDKQITDRLVHTFFHEGFHQFLGYYVPDPPIWINEGFAEMFEAIQVRGSKLFEAALINEGNLHAMQNILKHHSCTPLRELIYMNQEGYYANTQLHYPQGWSLVHFLAKGSPSYQKYFRRVLTNLKNGMDRTEALDDVFEKVNWAKMEQAWKSYVLKLRVPSTKNVYIY